MKNAIKTALLATVLSVGVIAAADAGEKRHMYSQSWGQKTPNNTTYCSTPKWVLGKNYYKINRDALTKYYEVRVINSGDTLPESEPKAKRINLHLDQFSNIVKVTCG